MTAIVRSEGLVKRYDRTLAVAGVDLDIAEGEIFGLVGPNGAGKTTTLRILATLLEPTAGDAEIAGWSVRRNPNEVRRVIGFMPDVFGVYDDMRVWEYLDFFARCYGLTAPTRKRIIGDLLELVELADKRNSYVQGLSRGMQQRLCLAHALVHDPKVLLLDEPASGLDPRARVELRELLRELRTLGKTIVISSHILPELEELCTSVAIVDRGRVLASGRIADIEQRLRVGAVLRVQGPGRRRGPRGGPRLVRRAAGRRRLGDPARRDGRAGVPRRRGGGGGPPPGRDRRRHPDRDLLASRERPRGALPAGHRPGRAGPRPGGGGMTGATLRRRVSRLAMPGITAIGVKELRGRMRGKRAFVSVTVYTLIVAGFAWMVGRILVESAQNQFQFDPTYQSAGIGRGIFMALMILQTLMILVLAPASTAGTISSEREKQTLDLLAVTPISSVAIVVGKLLSALTWVFVLILASIPVTALVFVYGGVAPDDVIRGYAMLFVTAIAFGAIGTFFSSLLRRSGAATGMTFVAVLVATVGLSFIWVFMRATTDSFFARRPPEALLYLNPFVGQVDVACGTEGGTGSWCQIIDEITGTSLANFGGGVNGGVIIDKGVAVPVPAGGFVAPAVPAGPVARFGDVVAPRTIQFGGQRDRYWPRSALTLMLLAVAFTAAAVQLVTPTRRWRPRLPGIPRRRRPGRSTE